MSVFQQCCCCITDMEDKRHVPYLSVQLPEPAPGAQGSNVGTGEQTAENETAGGWYYMKAYGFIAIAVLIGLCVTGAVCAYVSISDYQDPPEVPAEEVLEEELNNGTEVHAEAFIRIT